MSEFQTYLLKPLDYSFNCFSCNRIKPSVTFQDNQKCHKLAYNQLRILSLCQRRETTKSERRKNLNAEFSVGLLKLGLAFMTYNSVIDYLKLR